MEPAFDISSLTLSERRQLNEWEGFLSFKPTWLWDTLVSRDEKIIALFTGNQCLHGDTGMFNPLTGDTTLIKDIKGPFHVLAWDGTKLVPAMALTPFENPPEPMFRVKFDTGKSLIVTAGHRLLTSDLQYAPVRELRIGSRVFLPPSTLDTSLKVLPEDVQRSTRTVQGSICDCSDAFTTITSITENQAEPSYDFHVPFYNNYMAGGVISHNCGKTNTIARQYVLRFVGLHPVLDKNLDQMRCANGHRFGMKILSNPKFKQMEGRCPKCEKKLEKWFNPIRTYRFASETLPGQNASAGPNASISAEVRNTQYPALKRWMPPSLLKKDITARNPVMTIKDVNGGPDIMVEFVSYNQSTQAMAGTQRASIFIDEEPPALFLEEQFPRLLAADGDMVIGLTPANRLTHMYDAVYEKAATYYSSPAICKVLEVKPIEQTSSSKSIAVIRAATDDNPTLDEKSVERIFDDLDDPDVVNIRRYGVFKQVSGRIFKGFEFNTHYLGMSKWFPHGIPHDWTHGRMIDYHERVKWACMCIALSPEDEAFVYLEYNPDPSNLITQEIARELASMCGDYKYQFNLIDPLSVKVQVNTGMSSCDDLNRYFHELKRDGIGTGAYWRGWDTKSTRGREEIQKRLKNARRVGKPFNNTHVENGRSVRLPTLWIMDTCPITAKSMKNWRLEEWSDQTSLATKEQKESPQQRWSHFPMCLEAIFKEQSFRPMMSRQFDRDHVRRDGSSRYFASAR